MNKIYYKNNQTGQVREISEQGWELLRKNKKTLPNSKTLKFVKATKKEAEEYLESRKVAAPVEETGEEKAISMVQKQREKVVLKALKGKVIGTDKDGNITLGEETFSKEEALANDEIFDSIEAALKDCTNC